MSALFIMNRGDPESPVLWKDKLVKSKSQKILSSATTPHKSFKRGRWAVRKYRSRKPCSCAGVLCGYVRSGQRAGEDSAVRVCFVKSYCSDGVRSESSALSGHGGVDIGQ